MIDFCQKMVYTIIKQGWEAMKSASSVYERLHKEYLYICLFSQGDIFDKIKWAELMGKIAFAAEYKMITPAEWETLFGKVVNAANGG